MPEDLTGWMALLVALALGYAMGRAGGRRAAERERLLDTPAPRIQPPPKALAAIKAELAAGNKIEAIRLMREATGMDLKASKEAVEAMEGGGQGFGAPAAGPR
jgi:ribosomal protein L7/L12